MVAPLAENSNATIIASPNIINALNNNPLLPPPPRFATATTRDTAAYAHAIAFATTKYFLVAFSVSGLYSIITTLASIFVIKKPDLKWKLILYFPFWDTLILGIIATATGTVGGVAYVGLKGNHHVGWFKVCNAYDKFCKHLAGSLAVALFGSIVTVLLIWLSAYNLHIRVPK
ncbi:CASP-like protein 1D1 [Senna tora]|uniref:CASP-like protein n=1 Tax=Senna tora TaxID=362788 RepID=A0A835CDW9_9FABA|nr:CASP-like protein 1D1 [Senna tora]